MRNNYVRHHFTHTPFRFVHVHFGPNRAERRAAGKRDRSGRLIVEASINQPYERGKYAPQLAEVATS